MIPYDNNGTNHLLLQEDPSNVNRFTNDDNVFVRNQCKEEKNFNILLSFPFQNTSQNSLC